MAKEHVMVIEDEEDILALVHYNLTKEGYQLAAATSGEEGLRMAQERRPDLVVLDLMLPGMDGLEVCRRLKQSPETAGIAVVMLTAKGEEADIVAGLADESEAFLGGGLTALRADAQIADRVTGGGLSGVVLAPAGVTARELIDEFCGGMASGHSFKAYLPGGASGGILPASMADIPLDFGTLEPHGCFVGSHAVVILSDRDDMKAVALNLMKFFEDESCGQCTPCRAGTEKAVKLMAKGPWDPALLTELSTAMRDASICGLGQAAPNPVLSVMKDFPDELERGEAMERVTTRQLATMPVECRLN